MLKINGIDIEAPLYIKVICGCGNALIVPAIENWAVAGLQGLRFKCLVCDTEYGGDWYKLYKPVEMDNDGNFIK